MKKIKWVLLYSLLIYNHELFSQQILDSLVGNWRVREYHNHKKTKINEGIVTFSRTGIFQSDSTYFGKKAEGFYRTDESQSVVYIEQNQKTSEWRVALNLGILKLERVEKVEHINKPKSPKIYLLLDRDTARLSVRSLGRR